MGRDATSKNSSSGGTTANLRRERKTVTIGIAASETKIPLKKKTEPNTRLAGSQSATAGV
jgi:hypothetical protein